MTLDIVGGVLFLAVALIVLSLVLPYRGESVDDRIDQAADLTRPRGPEDDPGWGR
jgi:hypothetical protein